MSARPHILIVTATLGYRHESIPTAEHVLGLIAAEQDVDVSFARTEDEVRSRLTPPELASVNAVFFVNTTGELPSTVAEALLAWVRSGGTFVGVHSASDTWHGVPDYIEMLGGEFIGHPPETTATIIVDDSTHPATQSLPPLQFLYEEFYYFGSVDLSRLRMLLSLRARPEPPNDTGYFPLAWEKRFGNGRVLYTALGHREEVWLSPWFRLHMNGAVEWAVHPTAARPKRRAVRH
ncbi:MAG TPA: ThuA domain-containing protein [Thermoanaerobaculia bacterium]|nr:ThuA domain-containing protein [Thermoanaerobaculia bacterium]